MNRVYRHIWSKALGRVIVVPECAKGGGGRKTGRRRVAALAGLSLLLAAAPNASMAADTDWTGVGGDNNWNNPANWSNGVPDGSGTSNIDNGLGSTVTVDGVAAPLNKWTNIGQYADSGNVAVINGGSLTGGCCLALGMNSGITGILTVSGPGSTVSNSHSTFVGWSGAGEIFVENGGVVVGGDFISCRW